MKKNIILLVILAFLAGAWFLMQKTDKHVIKGSAKAEFSIADSSAVNKIEIKNPKESYTFEKTNDGWYLTEPIRYKANQNDILKLVSSLKKMKKESLVSHTPDLTKYDLTDSLKNSVDVYENNKKTVELDFGKGLDYSKIYTLNKKDKKLYLVSNFTSNYYIKRDANAWRDKTILDLAKSEIMEINISKDKKNDFNFISVDADSFQVLYNGKELTDIDKNKVSSTLDRIRNMKCSAFIDSKDEFDPAKNKIFGMAKLTLQNGNNMEVAIYELEKDKDTKKYYVKKSTEEQIFEVNKYIVDNIFIDKEKLQKTEKK